MRVLSLFSGIGAHDLGLEWAGMRIVGQVELDEYCQTVLTKHWPKVPKWRDITTVHTSDIRARCRGIDLITGGFPCQDISTAGKQAGLGGERSGLWWHMWRIIRDVRPAWLLIENVPAIRTKGFDRVALSLEALGYTGWPLVVGAWAVGAPHQRNRMWYVAHYQGIGTGPGRVRRRSSKAGDRLANSRGASIVADSDNDRIREQSGRSCRQGGAGEAKSWWAREVLADADKPAQSAGEHLRSEQAMVAQQQSEPQSGSGGDVGNARESRLAGRRTSTSGPVTQFPMPPSPDQYDWEPPRTLESGMGINADGTTGGLARYGTYVGERRDALRAIGNANPPLVVCLVGRAIMRISRLGEAV